MSTVIALILMAIAGLLLPAAGVRAQTEAGGFLDPFPSGDRYRVQVWGDQMAAGLVDRLAELMAGEPRFSIERKPRSLAGLLKVDIDQEAKAIDAHLASTANAPHIVVMILGAGDRLAIRRGGSRRFTVGSEEWNGEYARRLDLTMRALRKHSIAVLWVGLPVMRREDASIDAEMMNEIFRGRALANGVRFIDIFSSFADPEQGFASHGPDIDGKSRLLRDADGVHFTNAGYRKLAYFVERELKRAASQAWDERMIPLAGSEAEQARVRPATIELAPPAPSAFGPPGDGDRRGLDEGRATRTSASQAPVAEGGVASETTEITLKSIGEQGREESVTLEILRPAIPAAIVSLVTRRESSDKPTQVGDIVMTEILGGLTVASSVTSHGYGSLERRRGSVDVASPLHRVLQRGEAMPPKPGRADEMPWPRPEPVLDARLSLPLAAIPVSAKNTESRSGSASSPVSPPMAHSDPRLPRRPSPSFMTDHR